MSTKYNTHSALQKAFANSVKTNFNRAQKNIAEKVLEKQRAMTSQPMPQLPPNIPLHVKKTNAAAPNYNPNHFIKPAVIQPSSTRRSSMFTPKKGGTRRQKHRKNTRRNRRTCRHQ
jgi:hypothetical protein